METVRRNGVSGAMAVLAIGAWTASAVGGASETKWFSISPLTFVAANSTIGYTTVDGRLVGTVPGELVRFHAPVHLPDGAQITGLRIGYVDQDASSNIVAVLQVTVGGATVGINPFASTGSVPGPQTASQVVSRTVDNEFEAYRVALSWTTPTNPDAVFPISVGVSYTLPPVAAACGGDVNGDNRVDGADLSVLLARFGSVCPP